MFRSSSGACPLLLFNGQLRSTTATARAVTKRLYATVQRVAGVGRRRTPVA